MLTDDQYVAKRSAQMLAAGLHPSSVDYLSRLERGMVEAIIPAVEKLSRTAVWEGRKVLLASSGIKMVYNNGLWKVIS